jgi:hypothetical protein
MSQAAQKQVPLWLRSLSHRFRSGSGFRLRAPASLTPARRLKFKSLRARQFLSLACHSLDLLSFRAVRSRVSGVGVSRNLLL